MADSKKIAALVSPDGKRTWTPDSRAEATNLRARGWRDKPATKAATPTLKSDK